MGIEPTSLAWEAKVMAIIRRPLWLQGPDSSTVLGAASKGSPHGHRMLSGALGDCAGRHRKLVTTWPAPICRRAANAAPI